MTKKMLFNNTVMLLLLSLCGLGCNHESQLYGLVPVEGIVYYDGKPLDGAVVNFIPNHPDQRSAVGTTDATGKFVLMTLNPNDGAAPGEYQVTVSKMSGTGWEVSMTEQQSAKSKDDIKPLLPVKYSIPAKSGLTAIVPVQGVKDLKFELKK
ncbi:MAG: carboxypeptidase-like regulatory domain-containing protein [Planctomycetaceae bacterium]|jgi:hypothetical protein|nr:carboxypeptidase-like regulatory domain-containing protein [Planctomycetaceae bacterium]